MIEGDGPIVAAVRKARAQIFAEYEQDLERLIAHFRKIEAEHIQQIRSPRRERLASSADPKSSPANH